ncbi:DMT family transporter [Oceaniglobus roseus]|uniref:DMT family transporter n=1 Tax=Oceaniglobus roseus TaxID=1737570 RepID=UPI001FE638A0|nr:DMT family transporter [Kandeliimicrobium roseum]
MRPLTGNARGIALMVCAILLFSVMDLLAKAMSQHIPTVMAVWARYAGQTVVVTAIILPRLKTVLQTRYPGFQFLRSMFLLGATSSFFLALAHLGLAEAAAIMNLNPVLITLGAGLFLGEKLGIRRLAGIAVALVGALIIIRPGSAVFSPYALLPLVAAVCYSSYALVTRHVGRAEDAWTSLFYTAILGAVVLSAVVPFSWVTPDWQATLMMLAIGVFGGASQLLLIKALMQAEASLLAPFAYLSLLFASIWGFLFFGEVPDAATGLGALVIVGAGLYVWHRETRKDRKDGLPPQPRP